MVGSQAKPESQLIFQEIYFYYFLHNQNLMLSQNQKIEVVNTGIVRIQGPKNEKKDCGNNFTYLIDEPIIKNSLFSMDEKQKQSEPNNDIIFRVNFSFNVAVKQSSRLSIKQRIL